MTKSCDIIIFTKNVIVMEQREMTFEFCDIKFEFFWSKSNNLQNLRFYFENFLFLQQKVALL